MGAVRGTKVSNALSAHSIEYPLHWIYKCGSERDKRGRH